MVRICFLCKKKATKNANFTMHKFPKEVSIRAQWLHACKLSDKDNVTHVYICSDHFIQSDYRHSTELLCQKKWLLKSEAVPSIGVPNPPAIKLQFQSTCKNMIDETRSLPSIDALPTFTAVTSNVKKPEFASTFKDVIQETHHDEKQQKLYATPKKRRFAEPRYISEITTSDFSSPKKARRVIDMVKKTYKEKCNLIHNLQKKNRTLCKRITTLEELVKHLRKETLMSEEGADALMRAAHCNLSHSTITHFVSSKNKITGHDAGKNKTCRE
ncbi:uncharacterized protein LOC109862292 [Pseudomyrmex gracilis]|uniref:uncharacterized protein LOC109862292 n=1 Tax=Pseudomyrmex gracilis TaxID=219809 RepID=UPI0009954F03|nr:uncharacterized protein LOC109862292 [Pseudomyrmex gracilis]XP_020297882.1 uncharacterized protein LOC109862292 [Pseudomyrmex gracilis]XP_020297883.1 uncharacterized protein LOC109862292 [Pseudomyrmex gracilis]